MQVLILAGGLGTRMRPYTVRVPKTLIEVRGRPFAHHQLDLLARAGVERVVYSIGYRGEMIRDAVGDGSAFGLHITYVDEGEARLGTGGAVRLAAASGALDPGFMVLYGDSYLPIDYRAVWEDADRGAVPLMTVFHNGGQFDASNVIYRDGQVVLYDKGRPDAAELGMAWIDYGLSVLQTDLVLERVPAEGPSDLATLFHALSVEGRLRGHEVHQRFYEIGTPTGLADLEGFLDTSPT